MFQQIFNPGLAELQYELVSPGLQLTRVNNLCVKRGPQLSQGQLLAQD